MHHLEFLNWNECGGSVCTKLDETETEQKAKTALHDQNVSKQSVYFGVIVAFVFKYIKKEKREEK